MADGGEWEPGREVKVGISSRLRSADPMYYLDSPAARDFVLFELYHLRLI